ncbi:MAG TPA: MBL fold metallo-hydrolase [Myxococcota bacterium]|jgi:ribonuclease Z|nr:MBL fold metallo-hydrolase [Myxococcota bacterium]
MRRAAILSCVALAVGSGGCDRWIDARIERNLGRVEESLLRSPDLTLVLCGTGSPLPDATRAGPCTAVVAGGGLYLVDAGPGSFEVVDLANLPTAALRGVFLTHFHSDHIGDLGEAITQSWIAGRAQPLDVYGPPGTAQVVAGFAQAYAFDVGYRVAHHGDAQLPKAAAGAVAHEVELPPGPEASALVLERDGLRVTMFRVDHTPVSPAVGYRFEFAGRSVVVSGDTRPTPSIAANARGADILVHEALDERLVARAASVARRMGEERRAKLATDILAYHTTPLQAAEAARAAGVPHLVLTHLVPAPDNFLARRAFLAGVADVYAGRVTLGEDGMRFTLAARPPEGDR